MSALDSSLTPPTPPSTHPDDLEAILKRLAAKRADWGKTPLARRRELLERVLEGALTVAERWVEEAARGKGLDPHEPRAGDEWLSGPMPFVQNIRLLMDSLAAGGRRSVKVRTNAQGRNIARVFPLDLSHRLLLAGTTADIWLEPGKPTTQGTALTATPPEGRTALVLGASNITAIAPMDALYKLFVEGHVTVLKVNPVAANLGPLFETAFRPLVDEGVFAVVYGGADVGALLANHPLVDTLHVTGSDATYEAIVFGGAQEERERKKAQGLRQNERPFTAELGCVTPVLLVPGPYALRDLAYQARHVAGMLTHNGGFNCDAAQVLIVGREWLQKDTFLRLLREELAAIAPRPSFIPGAAARRADILTHYPSAEAVCEAPPGTLPWTLLSIDGDRATADEWFFRKEAFCGALAVVELSGAGDAEAYLAKAVPFANERLWGTLSASLIVHPSVADEHGAAVERAIAELRYGGVGVNAWPGVIFALAGATWGAFPGHTPEDIQSGTGVVHNAMLFDHPEKTVVRAAFRSAPPPPYFPNLEGIAALGRALTAFEASPSFGKAMAVAKAGIGVSAGKRRKKSTTTTATATPTGTTTTTTTTTGTGTGTGTRQATTGSRDEEPRL